MDPTGSGPARFDPARMGAALVRAAMPIAGAAWLGWSLATVLFYFWLELALFGVGAAIFVARHLNHPQPARATLLVFVFCEVPAALVAWYFTPHMSAGGRIDYALSLMHPGSMRLAVAVQVVAFVSAALLEKKRFSRDQALTTVDLALRAPVHKLVLIATAFVLVGLFLQLTGIGEPAPDNGTANFAVVLVATLIWAWGELFPDRWDPLTNSLFREKPGTP